MLVARLLVELALRPGAARRAGDDQVEPLLIAGLLEEIVGAEAQRPHRVGDAAVAGEEDPFAAAAALAHLGEQVERVAVRQLHVRDDHQRRQLVVEQRPPRAGEVGDQHDLPAAAPEMPRQLGPEQRLVLDEQQRVGHTSVSVAGRMPHHKEPR